MKLPPRSEILKEKARRSFWEYCKLLAPSFYNEDRKHLKTLCEQLQKFYERKTRKRNLLIQMPPRHGKSRTLTNFASWGLGKDNTNKIITASFNDDLAQDFSRHTRDIIQEEKTLPDDIVYSDIFPETMIKKGDSSYKKWALEGQFFNYKGTGIGGSITGRGGNILIIDDPVKDAETAYNPLALEKIWLWYTGTLLSRGEEGNLKILCMTPWAKGDLASKLLELEPDKWLVLTMPAYDGSKMLCPDLLSYDSYLDLKSIGDEAIFLANYQMERIDIKGRLYSGFMTYEELPENTSATVGYTDTADEGKDFLCSLVGYKKGLFIYVTDVLYTKEPHEITEGKQADLIIRNNIRDIWIESNNGGRGFARNVQKIIQELKHRCSVKWFHQSKNKIARIMTNASTAQKYILFPENWATLWPEFYYDLMTYQKEGKNKHDDAPDALTGLMEKNEGSGEMSVPDMEVSF